MKSSYLHSFFCGHIATNVTCDQLNTNWVRRRIQPSEYVSHTMRYYESFVDSIFEVDGRTAGAVYGELAQYTYAVDRCCSIGVDGSVDDTIEFRVANIHLYFFPFDVVLFAIEVECDNADIVHIPEIQRRLRNSSSYVRSEWYVKSGYLKAIMPLLELCVSEKLEDKPMDLTLTGNKLKIFQTIRYDEVSDSLLFELGTLSDIGAVADIANEDSPSPEYYASIIEKHRVSVYRNWSALALFDTMTFLTTEPKPAPEEFDGYSQSYFRLIYLHLLYQKTLLYGINREFHEMALSKKDINSLVHKRQDQEFYYGFPNISYNFLPQLIYEKIQEGMDIESERNQLKYYLEQESEKQNKRRERTINNVLAFIAVLSLCSAIYDGSSLIREYNGYERVCEYQTVVWVFIALIIVCIPTLIFIANKILKSLRR